MQDYMKRRVDASKKAASGESQMEAYAEWKLPNSVMQQSLYGVQDRNPSIEELRAGKAAPTSEQLGRPLHLEEAIRARMERSFGMDLSSLKLYESQTAADAGAAAVAQGNRIAFAPGKANFSTRSGQELLGHEISHVVSQARDGVSGRGLLRDNALEARADREGAMAAAGEQVYSGPVTGALSAAAPSHAVAAPMQAAKHDDPLKKQASAMATLAEKSRGKGLSAKEQEKYNDLIANSMSDPKKMQAIYLKQAEKRKKEMAKYGTYQSKTWVTGKKYSSQDRYQFLLEDIEKNANAGTQEQLESYRNAKNIAMKGYVPKEGEDQNRFVTGLEQNEDYMATSQRWEEGGWRKYFGHQIQRAKEDMDQGWVNVSEDDENVPRAFRNKDAAYHFMGVGNHGEYDQWSAKLQPEEEKSLYDYTRQNGPGNFKQVNMPLRNNQPLSPERTQQVEAMDRGISKSNLNQPIIVHRGSGAQLLGGQTDPKKIMKMFGGRTVKDKGFLSTSALKANKFNGDIHYRITVTSGKGKGSFLAPMSRHKKENEYLIKRNAPMIVRDAYKRNGQTIVDLEVLDEDN